MCEGLKPYSFFSSKHSSTITGRKKVKGLLEGPVLDSGTENIDSIEICHLTKDVGHFLCYSSSLKIYSLHVSESAATFIDL